MKETSRRIVDCATASRRISPSRAITMEPLQEATTAAKKTDVEGILDVASLPFVGRWNKLVTTTNWEKGRIIHQWREAMIASGAPVTDYSDEAWARRVAGVTGQHVGRLRRVYQKFGETHARYDGLFWSHFQAALDWDDADGWLEKACSRSWSVSQMRHARWEALGVPVAERQAAEPVEEEIDADFESASNVPPEPGALSPAMEQARSTSGEGPSVEGPDFGDEDDLDSDDAANFADSDEDAASESDAPAVRPFEQIGALPDDVTEAFEAYKLAILRHKRENWSEIGLEEMLATLDALKELATAPTREPAPF